MRDGKKVNLRVPGAITRDIKYIAPEELASGMLEVIKQNVTIDKDNLYHFVASKCGFARVPKNSISCLDNALGLLANDISVDGNLISINQRLLDENNKKESDDFSRRIQPSLKLETRRVTDDALEYDNFLY